jgi:predicted DNA-binding helix-hairpin-helix protein
VDVNTAARELLLRVPGMGTRSVDRLLALRRVAPRAAGRTLRAARALRRALPFVVTGRRARGTRACSTRPTCARAC